MKMLFAMLSVTICGFSATSSLEDRLAKNSVAITQLRNEVLSDDHGSSLELKKMCDKKVCGGNHDMLKKACGPKDNK